MELHESFRAEVDGLISSSIHDFFKSVPGARHQIEDKELNLEYYKRNLIEIILRLRMKRTIDALTIRYFTKRNPRLAKKWAEYTADEMLHDSMFAKDLERVGVERDYIYTVEPMLPTKLLQGYFYYGLEHEEVPLASLCSSYFIELASQKTQPAMIDHVGEVLGNEYVKGQRAHVSHDEEDDHIDFVWEVLVQTANLPEDKEKILSHVRNVYYLFKLYYTELYELTKQEEVPLAAV